MILILIISTCCQSFGPSLYRLPQYFVDDVGHNGWIISKFSTNDVTYDSGAAA